MAKRRKFVSLWLVVTLSYLCLITIASKSSVANEQKIRILIITGGHDFEREAFFKIFSDMGNITFREAMHPDANDAYFPDAAKEYDVMVFYDMNQNITEPQKEALVNLLKKGKGLVVLHHALANYQDWPEYEKIIGGRYFLKDTERDGILYPRSTYQHDLNLNIRIAKTRHPVTKGVKDFFIRDEAYGGFFVSKSVQPLLTTEHAQSGPIVGWAHQYGKSKVVVIQLGHDHLAYENANYRKLVAQAIRWISQK